MMKSHWITYRDKQILYCDYTSFGLRDLDGLKAEFDGVLEILSHQPERSVLVLADVRESVASLEAVKALKQQSAASAKFVRKLAVVGATGLKKILYDAIMRLINQPARAFDDLDEEKAKQWLVEDD